VTLDAAIAVLRGVHLAAVLSVVGAAVTHAVLAPAALGPVDRSVRVRVLRHQATLLYASAAVALVTAAAWLAVQSASMADAASIRDAFSAVPVVLADTVFGHAMTARVALLLLTVAAWRVRRLAAAFAVASGAAEAWLGHAGASDTVTLPVSVIIHVTTAGAWLGGLIPLFLLIRDLPGRGARVATMRFASLGWFYVAAMAATAFVQAWLLIGSLPGLIGTGYGQVALLKLALFIVLLGLAALNRYRLSLKVSSRPSPFLTSILIETGVGLCAVLAAAQLSEMWPATHEQPNWPFAWQPTLAPLADPDLGSEARLAIGLLAAALLAIIVAVAWRRLRWVAVAAACGCLVFAWPHLDLFAVTAYPTSFYHSPTGFAAHSIARGEALFGPNCAACHGAGGRGDGPLAKTLPIPPADLTADHIWEHPDGELFWWLTHGIENPEGGLAMPGFPQLSDDDRWALIDFVHANAAGAEMDAIGHWPFPVQAPGLTASCADGGTVTDADLRGRSWRIVAGDRAPPSPMPTVLLTRHPVPAACVASDPAAWLAASVVSGVATEAFAGTQLLVDASGWLRDRALPGASLDLAAAARPLPAPTGMHHH
jgi:putative copper export protein/mono/diheme cytochrome c family protein